jgi:DNA helicase-2/ATP-dependent DNA helicase PcrA
VEELINSLYEFVSTRLEEERQDVKLGDFLSEISLLTDQDTDNDESANRITMMTIHSAKGLEFKNVFVVGLEENLFPSEMCRNSFKKLEEERRLFYVALTRAEENAVLTYAKSRFRNGQSQICSPSRFIKDIDSDYLRLSGDWDKLGTRMSRYEPDGQYNNTYQSPAGTKVNPDLYTNPSKLSQIEKEKTNSFKRQSIGNLSIGNMILHERFGRGKVIELIGENENAKASVEFESFGKKQLLLKFAKFEII